ncbi:MAG: hypothetical protein ABIS35_12845 [Terracoccus sp.]
MACVLVVLSAVSFLSGETDSGWFMLGAAVLDVAFAAVFRFLS